MDVAQIRREYSRAGLTEGDLASDPVDQVRLWLQQAQEVDPMEFTAMTLATADSAGRPSARVVLLKGLDERGFVFFTNYQSRKASELLVNPWAALVLYWAALDRQVRVEGRVEMTSREETQAYFESRPRGSRLSAWASPQSQPVSGRQEIEGMLEETAGRFADGDIPLPEFWGGFRVRHETVELWQGRPNRLHDRLRYTRRPDEGWRTERLAP